MKRLALLLSLVLCVSAQATITRVQSTTGTTGSATASSFTLTFGSALTKGNTVIIAINVGGVGDIQLTSNSYSGGFHGAFNGTETGSSRIGYFYINTGGGTVLTIQSTNGSPIAMAAVAVEYSGFNLIPDATDASGVTGNSASPVTGTLATNFAAELMVGCLGTRGSFSASQTAWLTSPTNSFSSVAQCSTNINSANADRAVAFLERITTATVSITAGGTATSGQWAGHGQTFREVPGAGITFGN